MYTGEWDYFRYSYCGAVILIGFLVNLAVIGRVVYERRRRGFNRRRAVIAGSDGKLTHFYLSFTILTCFLASANLLLLITRDSGHLLETATGGDWRSTNFVCKLYKFASFLAYHVCSYSVLAMVACTCWYACRGRKTLPKQNRVGMLVAVAWALAVAFCAPLYHVAGLGDADENETWRRSGGQPNDGKRRVCFTIRPHDPANADVIFLYYPYFLIATILVVPMSTIVICYVLSGQRILAQRRTADNPVASVRLVQYTAQASHGDRDEIDESPVDGSPLAKKIERSITAQAAQGHEDLGLREPPKPGRRSRTPAGKKEKVPLTTTHAVQQNETAEELELSARSDGRPLVSSSWKICRIAAVVALTYAVCWLPYSIVYLLVAKGDVDPDTLSVTIPTYMLFLLYPIVSGVCLVV